MDLWDWLKVISVSLLIVLVCAFFTVCFLPKTHQGYYMLVRDGSASSQIYPVFRIYNNWKYYPDEVAFESISSTECLKIFEELCKGK